MKKTTLIIALLFAVSGISGLVYELVWIRLLSQLLGGTTMAISTVLAAFMGGLALGSHYFGKRVDSHDNPLLLYARLEIGVAVLGALVPAAVLVLTPVYIKATAVLPGTLVPLLRIVLTFILLLPPTILMGGTLPVLSRFLVRRNARLGRSLGLLYAVNTLGAVLGIALSGFVLIPAIGLTGSTLVAVAGNALAGGVALILARSVNSRPDSAAEDLAQDSKPVQHRDRPELSPSFLAIIFGISGFAALGLELYWTRALHHFLGNSTYAFSAMLTTYLAGLAAGSWAGGRLADRVSSPARTLGWVQLGLALSAAATLPLIWIWLPGLDPAIINPTGWTAYLARRFLLSFAVMALPTFLSGMTFPLVNRIGIRGLKKVGGQVGNYYFANTAGSIVGSLAAGFVLLPLLGVRNALLATCLLSACIGLAVLFKNTRKRAVDSWVGLAVIVLLAFIFIPLSRSAKPFQADTQHPGDTVLFDREDATAHTRVFRKPNGEMHMAVDGHHIGGTEPTITRKEKILAHLPMVLVPHARHTLSVGLGSGVTLGTLGLYDEIEKMTCVEIVPGVIEGARKFAAFNGNVLQDPRLEMILGDGIQHLLTTTDTYDVISSDSKLNPEYSGNSALLSLDYYRLCQSRLADQGIMVQWLALHFPAAETQTVIRSFTMAFEYVELFWIDPNSLILVGSGQPVVFDFDRFAALTAEADVKADLILQNLADPYVMVSCRVAGKDRLVAALGEGRPNTWQRPTLEFSVLREVRSKSIAQHEDDNFLFLIRTWDDKGLPGVGNFDSAPKDRFTYSTYQFMLGYGSGGGVNFIANGRDALLAGLKENPEDNRISQLLELLDQDLSSSVLATGPQDSATALRLAKARIESGQVDSAVQILDQALRTDPHNSQLIFTRVTALRRLGRLDEALGLCEQHIKDNPQDSPWISQTSIILSQLGRLEESLVYARRAVELQPESAINLNNLATTLGRLQRYDEAADAFSRAHEMDSRVKGAAFFAAASYSIAGKLEKCVTWVEICLEQKLATTEDFRTNTMFENLRNSAYWREEWDR